jgi:hypothetical protein
MGPVRVPAPERGERLSEVCARRAMATAVTAATTQPPGEGGDDEQHQHRDQRVGDRPPTWRAGQRAPQAQRQVVDVDRDRTEQDPAQVQPSSRPGERGEEEPGREQVTGLVEQTDHRQRPGPDRRGRVQGADRSSATAGVAASSSSGRSTPRNCGSSTAGARWWCPGEEDFGRVSVEAQACGTPVLALGAGGSLDTVVDGITGRSWRPVYDDTAIGSLAYEMRRFDPGSYDPAQLRRHAEGFAPGRFCRDLQVIVGRVLAEVERAGTRTSYRGTAERQSVPC